jgi:hypothetical protein
MALIEVSVCAKHFIEKTTESWTLSCSFWSCVSECSDARGPDPSQLKVWNPTEPENW